MVFLLKNDAFNMAGIFCINSSVNNPSVTNSNIFDFWHVMNSKLDKACSGERLGGEGCWSWQNCLRWNEISSPYDISSLGGRTTFTLDWLFEYCFSPTWEFPHACGYNERRSSSRQGPFHATNWSLDFHFSVSIKGPPLSLSPPYSIISYDKKGVFHYLTRRKLHADLRL